MLSAFDTLNGFYCTCFKHLFQLRSNGLIAVHDVGMAQTTQTCCPANVHRQCPNVITSVQVLSVVGLLQDETDPMVSVMKVTPALFAV